MSDNYSQTIDADSESLLILRCLQESVVQSAVSTLVLYVCSALMLYDYCNMMSDVVLLIVCAAFACFVFILLSFTLVRVKSKRRELPYEISVTPERLTIVRNGKTLEWNLGDCTASKGNGFDALWDSGVWGKECVCMHCGRESAVLAIDDENCSRLEKLLTKWGVRWITPSHPDRIVLIVGFIAVLVKTVGDGINFLAGLRGPASMIVYWIIAVILPQGIHALWRRRRKSDA